MKKLLLLTIFIIFNTSFAQEYKLGKVTIEELKETEHNVEKEAIACRLFSKGKTYMAYSDDKGFELVTEVENKIKIYKKEGFSYADFAISIYQGGSDRETVSFSDATTYNLVDGKIEKTKLKSDGEFTEKTSKYYQMKKITMPNVKVGSIIEYKYIIKSPFIAQVRDWDFQDFIPVNYSQFEVRFPEYYTYNTFFKGSLNVKTTKKSIISGITISSKERSRDQSWGGVSTEFKQNKISFNENTSLYELYNVPSVKEEAFVKNINNYVTAVKHELASKQFPNEVFKLISTTWEEVSNTISASPDFGGELNKKGYFEEQINKVILGKATNDEKLNAIYTFVKDNYKWNGFYGIYTEEGLKSIYKNKTGNVADLNLLLVVFLRHAGLDAHPILISSVSNGVPLFPSRTGFNYVIAGVELNGKTVLLDATDKFAVPNVIPARALNWFGRMIFQNGGSKVIDLNPSLISKDNMILNYSITQDGKATGNVKRQATDYNAYNYRLSYGQLKKEVATEKREKSFDNIEIDNYTSENLNDLNLAVVENFDFVDDKHIEIIGDKIYFSPLLFYGLESNPFKLETRAYPIEFPFPYLDRYIVTIAIPEGYEVESIPKDESLVFGDKELVHKFIFTEEGKNLKLMLQYEVNTTILVPQNYQNLKGYFQKMVDKQSEKIVLKKK
ncbi:DUF3857 domain-containing protein [Flavobacterium ardleyense]|uniref:DUF3857 domain-containing protein n=1 Tax=Flavobacterium ardleyense TaxID=2038737 RepID=A0ABW5Z7C3_9FLAO